MTTRLGNSVPCILSSAPYYAAIRVLSQAPSNDTISMNLLPAAGPTGAFTPTNLSLVSKAPASVLNLANANSISVVKSGSVLFSDNPYVFSANPLTGSFVLNFMFNTDRGASSATDGAAASTTAHAVEFAVGLVTSVATRESFNAQGLNTFKYGMMVNGSAVGYKTDLNMGIEFQERPIMTSMQLTNNASQTIPRGGNHSLQIRFDGTNMSYYVDGQLATPVTGQSFTFAPIDKGPYYLVMSFANGDQFSTIPLGQTVPPTNFTLQVTMSELFGATNLLGTTLTHLQTFTVRTSPAYSVPTTVPTAVITTFVPFTLDSANSSATAAEVGYSGGVFTYVASDGASRAMINLTINVSAALTFNMRYLVFGSTSTPKITGPTIPASGTSTAWGLTMKASFILNSGDKFILQAWATTATEFLTGSTLIVEKLPVAQGGGGSRSEDQRWINVKPIPKRHPSRKSSLRISRMSTKKESRK